MKKFHIITLLAIASIISSCSMQGEKKVSPSDNNIGALSNTQSQVDSTQLTSNHE